MTVNVVRAFWLSGGLKAGTPLEIASTPVKPTQPDENALKTRKSVRPWVAVTPWRVGAASKSDPGAAPRAPHPSQVAEGHQAHYRHAYGDPERVHLRQRRRDGGHARGNAHRYSEHVPHHDRRCRRQPGLLPQVVVSYLVCPTAAGIGPDGLVVRKGHQAEQ